MINVFSTFVKIVQTNQPSSNKKQCTLNEWQATIDEANLWMKLKKNRDAMDMKEHKISVLNNKFLEISTFKWIFKIGQKFS